MKVRYFGSGKTGENVWHSSDVVRASITEIVEAFGDGTKTADDILGDLRHGKVSSTLVRTATSKRHCSGGGISFHQQKNPAAASEEVREDLPEVDPTAEANNDDEDIAPVAPN